MKLLVVSLFRPPPAPFDGYWFIADHHLLLPPLIILLVNLKHSVVIPVHTIVLLSCWREGLLALEIEIVMPGFGGQRDPGKIL